VDLSLAETYTVPTPPVAIGDAALRAASEEVITLGPPMAPRFTVDAQGRTTPIRYR